MSKPVQTLQAAVETVKARLALEEVKRVAETKRLDDARRVLDEHAVWAAEVEKANKRLATAKQIFSSNFNEETAEKALRDFGSAAGFGNPAQMFQAALNIAAQKAASEHHDRLLAEMERATVGQAAAALARFETEHSAVLQEFGAIA